MKFDGVLVGLATRYRVNVLRCHGDLLIDDISGTGNFLATTTECRC